MDLLMKRVPEESLEEVAHEVFALFGIGKFEERFSSHYVDDRYFVGQSNDLTVKVMLTDDGAHADLPLWIHLEPSGTTPESALQFIELLVKEKLLPRGYSVARLEEFGLTGEKRIDY
jgi:hypothetical protein